MKHISEELKSFLGMSSVTAIRLAECSGVASPYISRLITGRCKDVYSQKADALREAMLALDKKSARAAGVGL